MAPGGSLPGVQDLPSVLHAASARFMSGKTIVVWGHAPREGRRGSYPRERKLATGRRSLSGYRRERNYEYLLMYKVLRATSSAFILSPKLIS